MFELADITTFIVSISVFLILFVKVYVVAAVLFSLPIPLTWIERKVAGHIQVRLGPFTVGPHGILQPIADTLKSFSKEDVIPEKADRLIFILAPLIALVPACMVFVAIPFGESVTIPYINYELTLYIADMNVALLYILAISGLGIYGIIFGGWASNSKYAVLGGLRSAAQMISYEVALSFAAIGVVMLSNSLSLVEIVKSQAGGFWNWNLFYLPVGPVWFIIFIIAGIAEINRIPFDLPEDEGTLGAGFSVEYSGMKFAFFPLAEYIAMTTVSILAVLMFLGGWNTPFPGAPVVPPIFWFGIKVLAFIYFFMWTRFTFPRYRYDQLMTIGWKILIPICLVNLLVTGFMRILL
ncbi:MAG: NADH-quinone oxidoreductase subunit NuoH [Deltaproteobacteria bacterium]|nr:NADH-quinone oxidoreductase subunit NuoH [Deltaproteobacteria bacterium]